MKRKKTLLTALILSVLLFTGIAAANEMSFEVIPSTQILSVGDTLVLTVKIVIYDSPENFDIQPLSKLELPGFTTISTAPRHRKGKEDEKTFEERITTFKMIAESEGSYRIPSFEIPYTSPDSDIQQVLTSQELEITVYQGSQGNRLSTNLFIILIFAAVVLITVLGFFTWFKHIKSKEFRDEENQNIKKKFNVWAEELQKLLASGKMDTFTQQAYNYVNEFIEDNYQLGLKGWKYEKRILLMKAKGVSEALMELFDMTHHNLEEMKFGRVTKDTEDLTGVLTKLQEIERYK